MNKNSETLNSAGENRPPDWQHPLEDTPAFNPEAAARNIEEAKAALGSSEPTNALDTEISAQTATKTPAETVTKTSTETTTEAATETAAETTIEYYDSALDYIEKNQLNTPANLEKIIQDGDYDSFKKHLININGLVRNLDISHHEVDGQQVRISGGLTPISPEYKEGVLEETFSALKDIESPRDRGVLAYHTIGLLHLFADGNGRSQRIWYHLLSGEGLTEDTMDLLTRHNSVDSGLEGQKYMGKFLNNVSTSVSTYLNDFAFEYDFDGFNGVHNERAALHGKPIFSDEAIANSSIDSTDRIENIFANDIDSTHYSFPEMAAYLLKREDDSFNVPESYVDRYNSLVYKAPDNDPLTYFGFKSSGQVKRFIEIHNQLKLKQLHTLIGAFRDPQSWKYNDSDITLADRLRDPYFSD